jgi:hypothetical protein
LVLGLFRHLLRHLFFRVSDTYVLARVIRVVVFLVVAVFVRFCRVSVAVVVVVIILALVPVPVGVFAFRVAFCELLVLETSKKTFMKISTIKSNLTRKTVDYRCEKKKKIGNSMGVIK